MALRSHDCISSSKRLPPTSARVDFLRVNEIVESGKRWISLSSVSDKNVLSGSAIGRNARGHRRVQDMSCRLAFIACLRLVAIGEGRYSYDCALSPDIVRTSISSSSFLFEVLLSLTPRNELLFTISTTQTVASCDRVSAVASASLALA